MQNFIDEIRDNRGGKYALPYHAHWNETVWRSYFRDAGDEDTSVSLMEAGVTFGSMCSKHWQEIENLSKQLSHPAHLFRETVAAANYEFMRRAAQGMPQYDEEYVDPFKGTALSYEDLSDSISDLYFKLRKEMKAISVKIDLPDSYASSDRPLGYAVLHHLQQITVLRFCFEKRLFLNATVVIKENHIEVKSDNGNVEEFNQRRCVTTLLDCDNEMWGVRESTRMPIDIIMHFAPYKVIVAVENNGNRPYFSFDFVCNDPFRSRLLSQRKRIESEYLFETLGADGQQIAFAWDVIHSLCDVVLRNPQSELTLAEFRKSDLIKMIQECLGITVQKARKAVDYLTLSVEAVDGVWSRPLLPVDNTHIQILYPSVLSISPLRFLHLLVANMQLRKERGHIFEKKAFKQIVGFSRLNPYAADLEILERDHPIYKLIGHKKYETDFFARLGSTLIIADVKSITHIAGPREFYHAKKAIMEGVRQVKTRIKRVEGIRDELLAHLNCKEFEIFGMVITSEKFFAGAQYDGVPIIDLMSLISFVRDGKLKTGVAIGDGLPLKTIEAYEDKHSFNDAFFNHVRSPLQASLMYAGLKREQCRANVSGTELVFDRYIRDRGQIDDYVSKL
ncbi:MAG: hypothetical protein HQL44_09280 [Alphaproteobacteria bacterium]|nr:hypothetical protein [Alphaproteobacteria bacterium]